MTTTYIPNAGEEAFLDLITSVGYTVRLFQNDVTSGLSPTQIEALTAASFTEATFPGYAAVALTGGSWVTTQDDPSTATYGAQNFTRNSTGTAQTIYGFYVTLTAGGALRWFEYFDAPIVVTNNGDIIRVVPRLTLDDGEDTDMSARGIIAYREEVDDDGPYTVDSVTDLAIANVPVVSGRRYGIHLHTQWAMNSASQRYHIQFRVNGSIVDRFATVANTTGTANNGETTDSWVYWSPSVTAGTDDIDVYMDAQTAGQITMQGTATSKRTLTVVDLGLA